MVNIDLTSLDFCSNEIKPRNNAIMIAKAIISIALLLVMVMSIAYPSVHVTCCIASTTVRVIPIATVDVHAHTILIIVEIHAKKITKIITINVEINNEFSQGCKLELGGHDFVNQIQNYTFPSLSPKMMDEINDLRLMSKFLHPY